eukprot:Sspe_Gene.15942::Locus_5574_Transcript_2_3_Confidence_0.400_Length_717::g.15942::m.15942
MATLAMRPKAFVADERGVGGRQMLQQQFRALHRRVNEASTQVDTCRSLADRCVKRMIESCQRRRWRLQRKPFWCKVPEPRLPRHTMVDTTPPAFFDDISRMVINEGLRDTQRLARIRQSRTPSRPRMKEVEIEADEFGVLTTLRPGVDVAVGVMAARSSEWVAEEKEALRAQYARLCSRKKLREGYAATTGKDTPWTLDTKTQELAKAALEGYDRYEEGF